MPGVPSTIGSIGSKRKLSLWGCSQNKIASSVHCTARNCQVKPCTAMYRVRQVHNTLYSQVQTFALQCIVISAVLHASLMPFFCTFPNYLPFFLFFLVLFIFFKLNPGFPFHCFLIYPMSNNMSIATTIFLFLFFFSWFI